MDTGYRLTKKRFDIAIVPAYVRFNIRAILHFQNLRDVILTPSITTSTQTKSISHIFVTTYSNRQSSNQSIMYQTSTIFKRHETRHSSVTAPTMMTIEASDGTLAETLSKLSSRSTIYKMKKRSLATQSNNKMAPSRQYPAFSISNMARTSTIYDRNARRQNNRLC